MKEGPKGRGSPHIPGPHPAPTHQSRAECDPPIAPPPPARAPQTSHAASCTRSIRALPAGIPASSVMTGRRLLMAGSRELS